MTTSFPNNRSVLRRLVDHARVRPSACAVRDRISIEGEPRQLSYGQLNRQSTGMARSLRQQLAPGSVVLLCAPNACEFVTAFIGVWKAGMTVFPLSPSLNQPEISNAIVRSAASAVIGTKCILDALPETSLPTWRLSEVVNMSCEGDADEPTPANGALFLQSSGHGGNVLYTNRRPFVVAAHHNVANIFFVFKVANGAHQNFSAV